MGWVDPAKISAANSRDVLERVFDDRTFAEKSANGSRALAAARLSRPPKFRFGAQVKAKAAPKPKPKRQRTDETRAYFREYQRKLRAEQKAEAHTSP
jgi:hypothetical protein